MQTENYGSAFGIPQAFTGKSPFTRAQKRSLLVHIFASFVAPWIIFSVLYTLTSLSINYKSPGAVKAVSFILLAGIAWIGFACVRSWRSIDHGDIKEPLWISFLFVSCLIAWFASDTARVNYEENTLPWALVTTLNSYANVDVGSYEGGQLMDAGRIQFKDDTRVDASKAMGFRDFDTWCVAPIVNPGQTTPPASYDFWAVGRNCCSGHDGTFTCGEFSNPAAHSGMRMYMENDRAFYSLAVQQAEAAYGLTANHPIFFYWLEDPAKEINAYLTTCQQHIMTAMMSYSAIQLFLVLLATICISKIAGV